MQRLVDKLVSGKHYQAAYIHLFRMAPYLADHRALYRIVDLTDVISQEIADSLPYRGPISRSIYGIERPRIESYERWVAETFEETWLISEADQRILAADCPTANIRVVPNGVDLERFHPAGQPAEPNSLIFVGHLRVFHNVDAANYLAQEVLPLVREQIPTCTLRLVGANPGPEVRKLAHDPAVAVTGFVPDLNDVLNRSAVFVAPLRFAAGVQNKVLEAMAAGRPVVTTSLINKGLGARPGRHLLVADDTEAMVQQVVTLLGDRLLRAQVGQAGRQFVEERYSWFHAVRRIRAIEQSLASG
jgi:glycosyltransferase involved in cell wall biosynthesis